MPRKPKRRNPAYAPVDPTPRPCLVCETIQPGLHPRIPICDSCEKLAPKDLVKMPPAQRKRAIVFMGVGVAIETLKALMQKSDR